VSNLEFRARTKSRVLRLGLLTVVESELEKGGGSDRRGASIMAKPRGKNRFKAILRLVVVAGVGLYVLVSLYESRKQRALAASIADRVGHGDDHAAHVGGRHAHIGDAPFHGMHPPHAHHSHSRPLERGHAFDVSDPVRESPLGRTFIGEASREERLVEPVARGGSAFVAEGWIDSALTVKAQENSRKDADCHGGPHADDGGRFIDVLPRVVPLSADDRAGLEECIVVETIPGLCAMIAELLPEDGEEHAVLIAFDDGNDVQQAIKVAKTAAGETGAKAVLVAARTEADGAAAVTAGVPYARAACEDVHDHRDIPCNRPQFAVAAAMLALGVDVLLVGHGARLVGPNPLVNLPPRRGADAEGVPAQKDSLGKVIGMHDPAMGWSAYSQSMAVPHLMSSVVLLRATRASTRTAAWLGAAEDDRDADVALTDELLMPAYDSRLRSGATFRVLPNSCYSEHGAAASVAEAAKSFESVPDARRTDIGNGGWKASLGAFSAAGEDPNAILTTETFDDARRVVLRDGPIGDGDANGNCAAIDAKERVGPTPRALRFIAEPEGAFPVKCNEFSDLCDVVSRVANPKRQVLAAVSNSNILYMLGLFLDGVKAANISNAIVVALDKKTAEWCADRGAPYYFRELKSLTGSTDNHATSGLKFRVLHEFLSVGVSVLLSDVDVVWMRNPFGGTRVALDATRNAKTQTDETAIYGDSDVEGMTDGWDDVSAYGFEYRAQNGVPMRRLVARNSGLFYLSATFQALRMVERLAERMAVEANTWDQTAYNEEQVYLWSSGRGSAGGGGPPPAGVSQRVMNYACFQNTKYLFRYMRYDARLYDAETGRSLRPVSAHVNYHPEKPQRMVSLIAQYLKGERNAISKWSWSEGMAFNEACTVRPEKGKARTEGSRSRLYEMTKKRVAEMAARGVDGSWARHKGFTPKEDGTLKTPWGDGTWGVIPVDASNGQDRLFIDFAGAKHMVESANVEGEGRLTMTSVRCNDGEKVDIVL
jgi:hypothetical protein